MNRLLRILTGDRIKEGQGDGLKNRMRLHSAPSGVGGWERNANERVRGVQINVFICGSARECNKEEVASRIKAALDAIQNTVPKPE